MNLLAAELERLRTQVREQADQIKSNQRDIGASDKRHFVILPSKKLEKFKGGLRSNTDISLREWVAELKSHAETRTLTAEETSALILENLGGQAKEEILGRGDNVRSDPEKIFQILFKVFGDGSDLASIQQSFYSYTQESDLLTCSLKLVELYDRIIELDPSFRRSRDSALKGRFAECVQDENLSRELRRLNMEQGDLNFFELRDRAIQWLGKASAKKVASSHETQAQLDPEKRLLKLQEDIISKQQKQIDQLLGAMRGSDRFPKGRENREAGQRLCWICKSPDHMKSICPKRKYFTRGTETAEAGTPDSLN